MPLKSYLALGLSLPLLTGCHEHPQVEVVKYPVTVDTKVRYNLVAPYANVTGLVQTLAGNSVFIDLKKLNLQIPVYNQTELISENGTSVKVEVRKAASGTRFDILLASDPSGPGGTLGYPKSTGQLLEFSHGHPIFRIKPGTGVSLIGGSCPAAQTDWVAAGSDGTTIAIEVPDTTLCRIFLIKKGTAQSYVWFRQPDPPYGNGSVINGPRLNNPNEYYEIDNQRNFSNVLTLNGNLKVMINELIRQANVAGWPEQLQPLP